MKTALFVFLCYLAIIILQFVPFKSSINDAIVIEQSGILPNLLTFSIVCFVLLATLLIATIIHLKKPMQGHLIINRLDVNLKSTFTCIVFWGAFALITKTYFYFVKATTSYFLVVLGIILLYNLIQKWLVQQTKPNYLSINNNTIYIKAFLKKRILKIDELKMVSYNTKQNAILLSFEEGLHNIKLYLTDYDIKDLCTLINTLKKIKGEVLITDKNFNSYFASMQQ